MRVILSTLLCVTALFAPASAQELREAGKLTEIFRHEKMLNDIPASDRTHFVVEARIVQKSGDPVELWVGEGADREQVILGEGGLVLWHPSPELLAQNPPLFTNAAEKSLSLNLTMLPVLPVEEQEGQFIYQASDARLAVSQFNKAIGKTAGLMSFAAPKYSAIAFLLPQGAQIKAVDIAGATSELEPMKENDRAFIFDAKSRKNTKAKSIVASSQPVKVGFSK